MMMKPITFMLLAAVVLVDVMNGSVMAHRTHLVATAEEVANESDTKLVAASYGRNAVVSSIVWAQLASGYEWLTRPFTDVEETRESEGNILHTPWLFFEEFIYALLWENGVMSIASRSNRISCLVGQRVLRAFNGRYVLCFYLIIRSIWMRKIDRLKRILLISYKKHTIL